MEEQLSTPVEHKPSPFQNLFLARGYYSGRNEGWMYFLGTLLTIVGYFLFQLLIVFPLVAVAMKHGIGMDEIQKNPNILFDPEAMGMNRSAMLALMIGMFISTLFCLWLSIRFIHKKTLASVISGYESIRWKRYFFSFTVWGLMLVILSVISYFMARGEYEVSFDAGKFITLVVVAVLLVPFQTATEELFFRGYLLQGLSQVFKNGWVPMLITSILFGLVHGSNPEAKAHGLLIMLPYYISFGIFLGLLTLLDEGLELAMGIHCANNLVSCLMVTSKNSVLQTDAILRANAEDPGAELVAWIFMALVCFGILYWKYRWKNWKLRFQ